MMSYCTVCDVTDKKPEGRCPACGRNWGPSILDRFYQGPFDDPGKGDEQKPVTHTLHAVGVARMHDNDKAILVMLERRPTDDELRDIHELLAGRVVR